MRTFRGTDTVITALLLAASIAAGCAAKYPPLHEAAGIRVEVVHPSAAGQMLDLRYRIVDRELAASALNRQTLIYLIDQASGMRLEVPNMAKVGKLRQLPKEGKEDRIFWMLFGNPGGLVKSGSKVTLVIDETRIENIVVR